MILVGSASIDTTPILPPSLLPSLPPCLPVVAVVLADQLGAL